MSKRVKDIMSLNVITINVESSFIQSCRIFEELNIHHLPVVDNDHRLIGMFSTTDALHVLSSKLQDVKISSGSSIDNYFTVEDCMNSEKLYTIRPSATISKAYKMLDEAKVHSLVVMHRNKIVGILTYTDLLKYYKSLN